MSTSGQRLNWDEVRARLAQNKLVLEKALVADATQVQAVFERRATQLARRKARAAAASTALPVQVFLLGEQRYGIQLSELAEIVPFTRCTPVPGAPAALLGVINLRGDVCVVADLSRLLGLSDADAEVTGYVLLLGKRGDQVGVRVDRLDQIRLIRQQDLSGSGAGPGELPGRYVKAFTPDKLILLSAEAIRSHGVLARMAVITDPSTNNPERAPRK